MHLYSAPAYSIGKSSKPNPLKKESNPGPTTYRNDNNEKHRTPSWKMGKSRRNSCSTMQTPGPGSYAASRTTLDKSRGVSFKGRPGSALGTLKTTPGPGAYQPQYSSILKNDPSYKMPTDRRMSEKSLKRVDTQPGPGTYTSRTGQNWRSGPKFGSSEKEHGPCDTTPGPCAYSAADQVLRLKRSVPKFSFGNSQRAKDIRPSSPGPGAYKILSEIENSVNSKKGFKIPESQKRVLLLEAPGPGTYNVTPKTWTSPAFTISGGPINDKLEPSLTPGPASYNPSDLIGKMGVAIGKAKRDMSPSKGNQPGPGKYDYTSTIGSGPKFTIQSKIEENVLQKSPGPCRYQPKISDQHVASPIIPKQMRQSVHVSTPGVETPGPGFYKPRQFGSIAYSMGKEKRDNDSLHRSPGPARYETYSGISNLPQYALSQGKKSQTNKQSI